MGILKQDMKRTIRQIMSAALLTAGAAVLSGCSSGKVQDARALAENFAKAYYSADYQAAAAMCSAELRQMVIESGDIVDSLPDAAKAEFLELSHGMQAYTDGVHEWTKDSVTVDFDIIYPGEIEPMRTSLTVVRSPETDEWKVVYAQERQ